MKKEIDKKNEIPKIIRKIDVATAPTSLRLVLYATMSLRQIRLIFLGTSTHQTEPYFI